MTVAARLVACTRGEVLLPRLRTDAAMTTHARTVLTKRLISRVLAMTRRLADTYTASTLIHVLPRGTQMTAVSWCSIVCIRLIELVQD